MNEEIGRYIKLDGLEKRTSPNVTGKTSRYVVKHDEVNICGKGFVQDLIEKYKKG